MKRFIRGGVRKTRARAGISVGRAGALHPRGMVRVNVNGGIPAARGARAGGVLTMCASSLDTLSFMLCLIALAGAWWAFHRLGQVRRETGAATSRAEAITASYAALLDNAPSGIVVGLGAEQLYFGNGKLLFDLLMESPDAAEAMRALHLLAKRRG